MNLRRAASGQPRSANAFSRMPNADPSRRQFLAFLAASPLLGAAGIDSAWFERLAAESPRGAERALDLAQQLSASRAPQDTIRNGVLRSPKDALDVFDFEAAAKARIPVAHWGYLTTGTDDDRTIQANREGFDHWALRPRRLIDVSTVDASVTLYLSLIHI